MLERILKLKRSRSFFLFGPRNTGKTTLIKHTFNSDESILINLLDRNLEDRLSRNPNELKEIVLALPDNIEHVIIDEVQKIPKLLDIVHDLIETTDKSFVMTGSSARKLKRGGANLLAGRAFTYSLFPFSVFEIHEGTKLDQILSWGVLPKVIFFKSNSDKKQFLDSYCHTYLREEIWSEQFIKKFDPFRKFLEVAAQMNGKIINYDKISKDVGVDDKTIKNYYSILEDTMIGFFLEGFQNSFRRRLRNSPKFYFFDTGVTRSLARHLSLPVVPHTTIYGDLFEQFIILECIKLSTYYDRDFKFSYLRTKDDVEVDLIVERPGKPKLFIEIKSNDNVTRDSISSFVNITKDYNEIESVEAICLSNDAYPKLIENVKVLPWKEGIKRYFIS